MLSYFHNLESFFEYMDIYCRGWDKIKSVKRNTYTNINKTEKLYYCEIREQYHRVLMKTNINKISCPRV